MYKAFVKLYLLSNDYPRPVYSDTIRDTNRQAMHNVDEEGKYLLKTNALRQTCPRHFDSVVEQGPSIDKY